MLFNTFLKHCRHGLVKHTQSWTRQTRHHSFWHDTQVKYAAHKIFFCFKWFIVTWLGSLWTPESAFWWFFFTCHCQLSCWFYLRYGDNRAQWFSELDWQYKHHLRNTPNFGVKVYIISPFKVYISGGSNVKVYIKASLYWFIL